MTIFCVAEDPVETLETIQKIDPDAQLKDGIIVVPNYNAVLNSRRTTGGSNTHPRRFCV